MGTRFRLGRRVLDRDVALATGTTAEHARTRYVGTVKVYAGMNPRLPLGEIGPYARRVESMGYDGIHVAETVHDVFSAAVLAVEHTQRIVVRTSVALAFVRSPTLTAYAAWDLARLSGGRFQLGLGTQIRQNVEDRYGMPWSDPQERLREYVCALDVLFVAFQTGEAPRYEGRHYRLTRMQPYFNPGPDGSTEPPRIYLGGVNRRICALAGEVAAGFVTHPTNSSPRYLDAICLPALHRGAERAGRRLDTFELVNGAPVITAPTDRELDAERERQRTMLAFLYSTPAYRRTLELHGWAELGAQLQAMTRQDRWDALAGLVTDQVLDALTTVARFDGLADALSRRFGALVDAVVLSPPADSAQDPAFSEVIAKLRSV